MMIFRDSSPQGYAIKMKNHGRRKVVNVDGVDLIKFLNLEDSDSAKKTSGWSNASKYAKAKRFRK